MQTLQAYSSPTESKSAFLKFPWQFNAYGSVWEVFSENTSCPLCAESRANPTPTPLMNTWLGLANDNSLVTVINSFRNKHITQFMPSMVNIEICVGMTQLRPSAPPPPSPTSTPRPARTASCNSYLSLELWPPYTIQSLQMKPTLQKPRDFKKLPSGCHSLSFQVKEYL